MSNLKWRTGFDWGSILVLVLCLLGAIAASSLALRLAAATAGLLTAAYMTFQYRNWNTAVGWRRVQVRATLLYASVIAVEFEKAAAEGRIFDRLAACRTLAEKMVERESEFRIDVPALELVLGKGGYLASVLQKHRAEVLPQVAEAALADITFRLNALERVGPEAVIAGIVEQTYGSLEAARYAASLAKPGSH